MMQGGEIFVPKIPSMRIVDLARTIAPDLTARDRRDQARESCMSFSPPRICPYDVELDDRYVISRPCWRRPLRIARARR